MKSIYSLTAAAVLLLTSGQLHGQPSAYSQLPVSTPAPSPSDPSPSDPTLSDPSPSDSYPSEPLPTPAYQTLSLPDDSPAPPPAEDYLTEPYTDCEPVQLYSSRFAIDLTLADFELDDGEARYWTNKPTGVTRGEFSLENDEGFGVRGVIWSLDSSGDLDGDTLDVRVATYYLDAYRRYFDGRGELLLGGGLAYGSLKIDSPVVDPVHRFDGLGGSLVGEGFYAILRYEKTDIGAVGRARLALLGPLEDNFGSSQAMLVDELGIGLELRRRWGKFNHKMWFLRISEDFQHWSDLDSPFSADQRVEGTTFTLGFAW